MQRPEGPLPFYQIHTTMAKAHTLIPEHVDLRVTHAQLAFLAGGSFQSGETVQLLPDPLPPPDKELLRTKLAK